MIVHFQVEAAPAVNPELQELAEEGDESALLDERDEQRRARRTSFLGRFGVGTKAIEDEGTEIAVGPGALRFFDAETGRRIGS